MEKPVVPWFLLRGFIIFYYTVFSQERIRFDACNKMLNFKIWPLLKVK